MPPRSFRGKDWPGTKAPACTNRTGLGLDRRRHVQRQLPPHLVQVREHIVQTWPEIGRITRSKAFVSRVGTLHGDEPSHMPRGFPANHPAVEFLKHRQFLASHEFPPELATSTDFYPTLLATFTAIVPLVPRFLNIAPLGNHG